MIKDFKDLIEQVKRIQPSVVAVTVAEDKAVMETVKNASMMGFIKPVLFGKSSEIESMAQSLSFTDYEVVDCQAEAESVEKSVAYVRDGHAQVLMKGFVNTATFMRGVLNREYGLRTGRLLSLLAVYELLQYHKLLYCSDSGINVAPDLDQKKDILLNALTAVKNLGIENPKVAILTANEQVDPKVKSTTDAASLVEMIKSGELPECIAEGPISFDIAFDSYAAAHKGIDSKISGDPDMLIFPNIETGNILGKSWLHFGQAKWAGIVLGAKSPIILGSRSDTPEIKINSVALACLSADR